MTVHQAKDVVAKGMAANKIYNPFVEASVVQDKTLSRSMSAAPTKSFGGKLFGSTIG